MLDDFFQRGKATVVVETTLVNLLRVEQGSQRRRHVAPFRATVGLETVNAEFVSSVKVVPGFGEDRRHVAARAWPLNSAFPRFAVSES